jgi:outer membrane protein OmpA-like peptidoglycan-associated protein
VLCTNLLIYQAIQTNEANMKRIITILISLGLVLVLTSCGKNMVVLIPDPDGNVGKLVVANEGGQQVLSEANQSVTTTDRKVSPSEVTKLSDNKIRSTFAEALAARPVPPAKFILYFLSDSTELTDASKAVLPQIIQTIQERGSTDIVISGHTDTVGTREYNYKVSLDRAKAIYDILVASGAVPANITVTSHGEGNPLIKTADNVSEPRNRRVEVVIR